MTWLQYIRQIKAHRLRMKRWGSMYVGAYPGYNARKTWGVETLCHLHDLEKWLFLPLLIFYKEGKRNRKHARKVYDAMNFVGKVLASIRLWRFNDEEKAEAYRYERIFDCLDRSMDPVARIEMGDAKAPPPLSQFLKNPEDLVLAKGYEQRALALQEAKKLSDYPWWFAPLQPATFESKQ
jgi:hypothetical protein